MLNGERVRLRALEPGDASELQAWHRDHELSVLDGVIYPTSLASWQAFIETSAQPVFAGVVLGVESEAGALIGYVSLKRTRSEDRDAELGIALKREAWGQGYGRDALLTLLRFAFDEMNLHRVTLYVLESNARARRLYQRCGFREEGRLREAKFRDGRYVDNVVMGLLASEFRASTPSTDV